MGDDVDGGPVLAVTSWASNAELIRDCARLGYIRPDDLVVDVTFGLGTWWRIYKPEHFLGYDLDPTKAPDGKSTDFRSLPHPVGSVDVVAFDPPYKLNGTPTHEIDDRYGVAGAYSSAADRHQLILDGMTEAARVLRVGGTLLVKCQDQVNSGRVHWQTDLVSQHAQALGFDKIDAFIFVAYRPQPKGRRQLHARRNHSTLFVFQKKPLPELALL